MVGGKVPKCITSTFKDTNTIVYFILNDKNIGEYKVYVVRGTALGSPTPCLTNLYASLYSFH